MDSYDNYGGRVHKQWQHFDKQYLTVQKKFEQQGKSMKILRYLQCEMHCGYWPKYIQTRHLSISGAGQSWINGNEHLLSSVRVLACQTYFHTLGIKKLNCRIDTLRLIGFDTDSRPYICVRESLIESFNLQRSLKN